MTTSKTKGTYSKQKQTAHSTFLKKKHETCKNCVFGNYATMLQQENLTTEQEVMRTDNQNAGSVRH
jgi:hypothetical protein